MKTPKACTVLKCQLVLLASISSSPDTALASEVKEQGQKTNSIAQAPSPANSAKDLFLTGLNQPEQTKSSGFVFSLELFRPGKKPTTCPIESEFYSGDGIRMHFRPNFNGYAYIYMERGSTGKRAVLYPQAESPDNRIFAGRETSCPAQALLRFDQNPGNEHIYFILSRAPIDPEKTVKGLRAVPLSKGLSRESSADLLIQTETAEGKQETFVVKNNSKDIIYTELVLRHSSAALTETSDISPPVPVPPKKPEAEQTPELPATANPAKLNTATEEINRPITDKWAFVIALSKYADSSMNLRAPRKDAENFSSFLIEDAGFAPSHLIRLYDREAVKINVMNALDTLSQKIRPDDLLVFYANCHGSCTTKRGGNYLLLYDYRGESTLKNQLLMQELSELIKTKIRCNRLVLIVQACHSGFVKAAQIPSPQQLNIDLVGTGRIIATACAGEESSWVYKRGGIFTMSLIPNLRRYSKLKEALEQTRLNVIAQTENDPESKRMHPVVNYEFWLGDDAVLTAKPSAPQP